MQAMGEHTRMGPQPRITKLLNFNRRLQQTPESLRVLSEWNLELDQNLVSVPGRILESQTILFGNEQK